MLRLLIGVAVIGCNSLALSPILGDIAASLDASVAQVARAMSAYGGATAASAFFLARYVDHVGIRRMLRLGGCALVAGIGASMFAQHWVVFVVAQFVAGIAAGVMLPSIYSAAAAIAPQGQQSVYVGRVLTGWSVAMVAGIPLCAFITDLWGWRSAYGLMAALAALSVFGFARLPKLETTQSSPAPSARSLLRIRLVSPTLFVCFLFMTAFYGVYVFVGDEARQRFDLSASVAGLLVLCYGAGFGLSTISDRIIDRLGARNALGHAFVLAGAMYGAMHLARVSVTAFFVVIGVWGFVNHFTINVMVSVLGQADPQRRTAIMGLYSVVSYLGAMCAGTVFGVLYDALGFAPMLAVAAAACILGAFIARLAVGRGAAVHSM